MNLIEKLDADLVSALKAGDNVRSGALKLLKNELHNAEIAAGIPLSAEATGLVVKKEIKKRFEAAELYRQGGRAELAEKESVELAILKEYSAPDAPEEEIRSRAKALISEGTGEFGALMGRLMGEYKGRADGSVVSRIVKEELGGNGG